MTESRGEIPSKINRYEILEAVGYGAMGAVYKAFDPLIKRAVAVKTLRLDVPPDSPDYKAFLDRFAAEARTAGRLSHPNIVTLYDVAPIEDRFPWLAMEYVEGQTVAEMLAAGRLQPELVVGLVSQIASAIDYAHGEGVIHRDIKPSNVIVFGGEKVKVTDFGIAKLMDAEITHSGVTMGTPSYMSPEQAMGERVDGRTDIFSLGVVAFEMLSGKQPFPGNNATSVLYKLVHTDPVHPDDLEVLGLLPDKWRDVFSKALAKDPDDRFSTAAEFVKHLEQCLGSWFGALEGETVIMKDPASVLGETDVVATPATPEVADEIDDVDANGDVPEVDEDRTLIDGAPVGAGALVSGFEPTEALAVPAELAEPPAPPEPAQDFEGATAAIEVPTATTSSIDDLETAIIGTGASSEDELDETVVVGMPAVAPSPAPSPPTEKVAKKAAGSFPKPAVIGALGALILFSIVALWLVVGRQPPEPPPTEALPEPEIIVGMGRLVITTEPEGATVLVNDVALGQTPLRVEGLELDTYELVVERDGFEPEALLAELTEDTPEASFQVALRAEPPAAPTPAFIQIRSEPAGAVVSIDGRDAGATPTDGVRVSAGSRVIRLTLEGYLPWEDTVRARSGRTVEVAAELTPFPSAGASDAPDEPAPPEPAAPSVVPGSMVQRGDPGVVNPECVTCPAVGYPEAARRTRQQGVVQLNFVIDENGLVQDVRVEESAGEIFDSAVVETVRGWRYEPATKDGVPVKMRWVQRFRFRQGR